MTASCRALRAGAALARRLPVRVAALVLTFALVLAVVAAAPARPAHAVDLPGTGPASATESEAAELSVPRGPRAVAVPSAAPAHGRWPLPGPPRIVGDFVPPAERWLRGHRGVDLAGSLGAPVSAVLPGRVGFVGVVGGVSTVVVHHGATRTTYQPVLPAVRRGSRVDSGARLGVLTTVGGHCGVAACLHLGWLRGSRYLDPRLLLGGRPLPVRLLPDR